MRNVVTRVFRVKDDDETINRRRRVISKPPRPSPYTGFGGKVFSPRLPYIAEVFTSAPTTCFVPCRNLHIFRGRSERLLLDAIRKQHPHTRRFSPLSPPTPVPQVLRRGRFGAMGGRGLRSSLLCYRRPRHAAGRHRQDEGHDQEVCCAFGVFNDAGLLHQWAGRCAWVGCLAGFSMVPFLFSSTPTRPYSSVLPVHR